MAGWESGVAGENQLGRVRYVPSFDGLRALCITAVILFHSIPYSSRWINNIAARGWCGVDVLLKSVFLRFDQDSISSAKLRNRLLVMDRGKAINGRLAGNDAA